MGILQEPRVAVAAIVGSTVIVLGVLLGIVVLSINGRGTEAIIALVGTLVVPLLGVLWGNITAVRHATNSTNETLLKAVIASPAAPVTLASGPPDQAGSGYVEAA